MSVFAQINIEQEHQDSTPQVYDWAKETDGFGQTIAYDVDNISYDRAIVLCSTIGSVVFAACEYGMAIERTVSFGMGIASLYASALLTAWRLRSR